MTPLRRVADRPEKLLGTLVMNAPLRALEISRGGCLLESTYPIEAGTAGRLRLEIASRIYSEEVRITRCQRLEGAGAVYRLGVDFLRTRRPGASSLRHVVYSMLEAKSDGVFVDDMDVVSGPGSLPRLAIDTSQGADDENSNRPVGAGGRGAGSD